MTRTLSASAALAASLSLLPLLGCVSLPTAEEVQAFTIDDEWRLGAQLAAELEQRLSEHPDPEAQGLLSELARSLVEEGALTDRDWQVRLVVDAEPYTFHAPGGHVYVSSGLVNAVDEHSQFTGLLAHEIAHAQLRHGMQLLNRAHGPQVMLSVSRGERRAVLQDLAANVAAGGTLARFARASEAAADREALRLLELTGRSSSGLHDGLARLSSLRARPSKSRYFRCHEADELRLAALSESPTRAALPAYQGRSERDRESFRRLREALLP